MIAALVSMLVASWSPADISEPSSVSPTEQIAAQLGRLAGHEVSLSADGTEFEILDAANDGPAMIGVVERRWSQTSVGRLILRTETERWELVGPLAIERIAGPGYKVWVVGDIEKGPDNTKRLRPRRLGILRSPYR